MRLEREPGQPASGRGARASAAEGPLLPRWLRRTAAYCAVALVVGAVVWFLSSFLLRVSLLTFSLAAALLLAALLAPLAMWLRGVGAPSALAALASVLLLVGFPAGVGLLLYSRVSQQMSGVATSLTQSIDDLRSWLVTGPLALEPSQVGAFRDTIVSGLEQAAPEPMTAAAIALRLLGALVLAVFAVFFLVKDGDAMWGWFLGWVPARRRERVDGAGRHAWTTMTHYVRGTVIIAVVDAVSIGAALFLLGVPLWLSLTLLTFVGAFVPLLGATLAGAAAVVVTLASNGFTDAVIVLVVVLAVQQLEGNLLQPLVMGRAVDLHPLVILVVVTAGTLLMGLMGAVVAVPIVAVAYRVTKYLADDHEVDRQ